MLSQNRTSGMRNDDSKKLKADTPAGRADSYFRKLPRFAKAEKCTFMAILLTVSSEILSVQSGK
jgi:hypothetical protein